MNEYNEINLKKEITTKVIGKELIFFEEIGSTSDYLKQNVHKFEEGTVVVAKSQVNGRGRRGNVWENGKNEAIFMSILLKPSMKVDSMLRISLVCSLSILQALKKYNENFGIKWPNDIVFEGKKVCGILTEFVSSIELDHNLILGIGINVNNISFDKDIAHKATSLKLIGIDVEINELVGNIIKRLEKNYYTYLQYGFEFFIDEYKKHCVNINKEVIVISGNEKENGIILDINSDGSLLFKSKNGEEKNIISNEVSVRGVNGYV